MGRRGRQNLINVHFFFVTTTVVKFTPVFSFPPFCDILINNIKFYQSKYKFEILAYVIMPTHFHWIVKTDSDRGTISDIMRDIKKFTAWQILDRKEADNLTDLDQIFKAAARGIKDQKNKLWMKRFDDEVIRNEKMFWTKLKYIHNNPVKAGLVKKPDEYKYSSARNYLLNDHSVIKIDTDYAGIEIV